MKPSKKHKIGALRPTFIPLSQGEQPFCSRVINLYLQEIERRLPQRNREDILKEIRSTLMDMIEDQNPHPDQPADEESVKAVLSEFGSPRCIIWGKPTTDS